MLIPEGTGRIEAYAYENSRIEEIVIPDSVTFIGVRAFAHNPELRSFTLLPKQLRIQQDILYECAPSLVIFLPNVENKQDAAALRLFLSSCKGYTLCAPHAPFGAFPSDCRTALIKGYVYMQQTGAALDASVAASYQKHLRTHLRAYLPLLLTDTDRMLLLLRAAAPSLQEVHDLMDLALQEENPTAHAALLMYRGQTFTDEDFDRLEEAEERKTDELIEILEDVGSERWYRRLFPTNSAGNSVLEYRGYDAEVTFPARIGKKKLVSLSIHPEPVPAPYEGITSLTLPCGYKKLSPYSLKGLRSLKKLSLPVSLEDFSAEAFSYTDEEQEQLGKNARIITVLDSLTITGDGLKYDTAWDMLLAPSKTTCYQKLIFDGKHHSLPDYLHPVPTRLTELVLPEGLRKVGKGSFLRLPLLEKVNIPSTLSNIGGGFLACCERLHTVTIAPDNDAVELTEDGLLISGKRLISQVIRKKSRIVIPDGIEIIDCFAFLGNDELTEVTIPPSVRLIGDRAFCDCTALEKVNMPDSGIEIAVQLNDFFDK